MIGKIKLGYMAAQNYGKKHFATAVKSMKELKAKVKIPNASSIKAFGSKHKVALVAGGGAAGTVAGYQHGKGKERKRAKGAITRMGLATAASQTGYKGKAWEATPSQRRAIIKKHNLNVDAKRAAYKKFYV